MANKRGAAILRKNRKGLSELFELGRQYDSETDPEKKAALEKVILEKCAIMKGVLSPAVCTDEQTTGDEDNE